MKTIENILKNHGVETKIENDKLFAFDAWTLNGVAGGKWVNATKWTVNKCKLFLGY